MKIPFQTLIDQISDYAIVVLDAQGIVKSWNAGAREITRYTEGEALGGFGGPGRQSRAGFDAGVAEAEGRRLAVDRERRPDCDRGARHSFFMLGMPGPVWIDQVPDKERKISMRASSASSARRKAGSFGGRPLANPRAGTSRPSITERFPQPMIASRHINGSA
jgi:PAS domain-containing protein